MSRTTTVAQNQPRPVHIQIMRRIVPTIMVAFVLFGAFMVYVYYTSTRSRLEQTHKSELAERTTEINDLISKAVADAQLLATQPVTQSFGADSKMLAGANRGRQPNGQT